MNEQQKQLDDLRHICRNLPDDHPHKLLEAELSRVEAENAAYNEMFSNFDVRLLGNGHPCDALWRTMENEISIRRDGVTIEDFNSVLEAYAALKKEAGEENE